MNVIYVYEETIDFSLVLWYICSRVNNSEDNSGNISKELEKLNIIMQQILDIMPRPASRLTRILETILLIVGIFGFIGILDTLFKWINGG